MKLLFAFLLFSFPSLYVFAAAQIVAHCAGYTAPNGLAYNFDFIRDPQNTGTSKSEIHTYDQDSHKPGSPVEDLGPEICDTERMDDDKIVCVTEFSEIYTLDPKTKTGYEAGDGYNVKYKCVFN